MHQLAKPLNKDVVLLSRRYFHVIYKVWGSFCLLILLILNLLLQVLRNIFQIHFVLKFQIKAFSFQMAVEMKTVHCL